ncbi:protein arginine kinase [Alloiococcus sp. CFN-8]|uniref:protein arginine kinase n=1 Tax=Alloiococcus sp. CFN-8 TaxID=3416081 RepID=UPI003CED6F24
MKNWMYDGSSRVEPIISSRIRIARNLKNISFPHKLNKEKAEEIIKKFEDAFYVNEYMKREYSTQRLWEEEENKLLSFQEKHLISPNLIRSREKSAFIINREETVSIMLNEEDHMRLQCINSGFDLREAYATADKIDTLLEDSLDYAFHEELGYLTSCPTNIGTGLRASVMIHLPALTINKEITQVLKALAQVGMTIRGLYGEGSGAEGNIYQISNQITLGLSEEEIIENLEAAIGQILQQENRARGYLLSNYKYDMEDKIFRSLAILESARVLKSKESLELLSNVRLGLELDLIKGIDNSIINGILVNSQPATLQYNIGRTLTDRERDVERAKFMRETLGNLI